MTVVLWLAGVAVAALGLAGVVLPGLPGAWLIVVGLALIAGADGFMRVGVPMLVVIGAASYAIDFVAAGLGTKRVGASPRAMLGATLGTLAGLFFGLPGLVLGPFVGAVLGELSVRRDIRQAGRAGVAAWIGFVVGM